MSVWPPLISMPEDFPRSKQPTLKNLSLPPRLSFTMTIYTQLSRQSKQDQSQQSRMDPISDKEERKREVSFSHESLLDINAHIMIVQPSSPTRVPSSPKGAPQKPRASSTGAELGAVGRNRTSSISERRAQARERQPEGSNLWLPDKLSYHDNAVAA